MVRHPHSPLFRYLAVRRVLPADGESVASVSRELGISRSTMYAWVRSVTPFIQQLDARAGARVATFSAADKLATVAATYCMDEDQWFQYCVQRDLRPEWVSQWTQAFSELDPEQLDRGRCYGAAATRTENPRPSGDTRLTHLTAVELSKRMRFIAHSTRLQLGDLVFVPDVHYGISPEGEPYFIWETILRDVGKHVGRAILRHARVDTNLDAARRLLRQIERRVTMRRYRRP